MVWQGCLSRYGDGLWAGRSHLDSQQGYEIFLYSIASGPALVPTQSLINRMLVVISVEVKWPGSEADHRLPSSVKVKNGGSIHSTSVGPQSLNGVVLN
jgi:hypothetical protein